MNLFDGADRMMPKKSANNSKVWRNGVIRSHRNSLGDGNGAAAPSSQ